MSEAPTWQQVREYLLQGGVKCPKCSSPDLSGSTWNSDAGYAWQRIRCLGCNFEWNDVYRLSCMSDLEGNDFPAEP
jgi:hypothetical protein